MVKPRGATFPLDIKHPFAYYRNKCTVIGVLLVNGVKVYVPVDASFDSDGRMMPTSITWEDGRHYHIDRVLDIRQAAAAKAGSGGDRYTVRINGQQSYLFFERSTNISGNVIGRWFVERKYDLSKLF